MTPNVADSGPLVGPLVELADYVAGERTSRSVVEGSQAAAHLEQQAGWTGDWGARPVQEALNGIGLFLAAAEDHLRSMSVLLANFGPVVLARAGLEAACKAWWMLEPGLSVGEFICRHKSEQLKSLHEQLQLPPSTIDEPDLRNRHEAILRTAAAKGITPHIRGRRDRSAPYIGEAWPWIGELARRVLSETLGAALYKYFYAVAHAASYSLPWAANLDGAAQVGEDSYLADLFLSPDLMRQLVTGAGFSYVKAIRRLYQLCGWSGRELEARVAVVVAAHEIWPPTAALET